jgi:outer membrane protein OmpA-like peptidoglycan-associated protein/uncharacterized protein YidB (DUF937 family)
MFDSLIREIGTRFGLGDKAGPLVQMLLAYMTNSDTGGLAGFVDKFKRAGLGAMASSWLGGTASAQSITPTQVEQIMGGSGGLLGALTSKLGISGPTATSALSFLLPAVMGKLTPGGSIPTSIPHDVMGFIGSAKGMLAGGAASAAAGVAGAGKAAGGGVMKWLPWVVAGAAALFLLNYCTKPAVDATKAAAGAAKNAASSTVNAAADAAKAAAATTVDATKAVAGAAGAAAGAAGAVAGAATTAAVDAGKAAVSSATDATKAVAGAATDAATHAAKAVAEAIPAGAGALSAMINGMPALKVYFDTGKTALHADFADKAKAVVDYLKANAGSTAVVSGFADPTGNAAANAELSKLRADAVAAAIKAAGIAADRVVMEKPAGAATGGAAMSNAEARRVEVSIRK